MPEKARDIWEIWGRGKEVCALPVLSEYTIVYKMATMIPISGIMFLCNLPHSGSGRTCDLFLTNRIQQRCFDVCEYMYMIILGKIVMSVFLRDSVPGWLWRSQLLCCDLPYWEDHMARNWGQSPTDSQKLRPSVWQPASNKMMPTIKWSWKQILPHLGLRWDCNHLTPWLKL